ncbi:MAG: type I-MYXAN CRISPR-associated protein Cmx8 [Firmicutes bacterium]|nr:type I-MYXAN CRISPR-associated protein Cmx8 [Bacillota bacterium]
MSKTLTVPNTILLEFDLFSLPTAQHKAGLAGLLLMIRSMEARKLPVVPEIKKLDSYSASIEFSKESIQALFDDLYDALWVEVESKAKWKDKVPKREISKEIVVSENKTKNQKYFIYDAVQAKGAFLAALYPDGDGVWVKLWRDMLWSTLRGIPLTRLDYERRAKNEPASIGDDIWKSLVKWNADKDKEYLESLSSAIFIGAQDKNSEKVSFQGEVSQNILLHFWTLTSLIFVPQKISIDGKKEYAGYVLTVPEPVDLEMFIDELKSTFGKMECAMSGYRPKACLIDVPEEGGLEYLYDLTFDRIEKNDIKYSLTSVEFYHLEKQGNNIRLLSTDRIIPNSNTISLYSEIRRKYFNPLFKSMILRNLLSGEAWFNGMLTVFNNYPWEFFVFQKSKAQLRPFFSSDAKRYFRKIQEEIKLKGGSVTMSDKDRENLLAQRVYRIIQSYVRYKTEVKSGIKYDQFSQSKDANGRVNYPPKYLEAREKVCSDAFLAMRGRREQDFVEYFTGTICSVPQFLPENDYLEIASSLMNEPEKVKTLAMLAVSAASYSGENKNKENNSEEN